MFRLILLGPPGAGKGTLAGNLMDVIKAPHISTGDIFRYNLAEKTPLGLKAKEFMDKGELVPDEVVLEIVEDRLTEEDCARGYLLDGFPRTIKQAQDLDAFLDKTNCSVHRVIELEADEETLLDRMTGRRICRNCGKIYHIKHMKPKVEGICDVCGGEIYQRDDDKKETVINRFSVHRAQTAPLIDYYKEKGLILTVDAGHTPQYTLDQVLEGLGIVGWSEE